MGLHEVEKEELLTLFLSSRVMSEEGLKELLRERSDDDGCKD